MIPDFCKAVLEKLETEYISKAVVVESNVKGPLTAKVRDDAKERLEKIVTDMTPKSAPLKEETAGEKMFRIMTEQNNRVQRCYFVQRRPSNNN